MVGKPFSSEETVRLQLPTSAVLFAASLVACAASADPDLTIRARTFLAALADDQRDAAIWPFAHPERRVIRFAPVDLAGARHGELDAAAKAAGEALLATVLSARGQEKVRAIRRLELDLRVLERGWDGIEDFRDPERYHWAIFGDPADGANWGFRFEGHHLSLNFTATPGETVATLPLFLGVRPRLPRRGMPSAGVAVLGEEERLARQLYRSLDEAQLEAATLPYRGNRHHMLGQRATLVDPAPVGLPRTAMGERQQAVLDAFLLRFTGLWKPELAAAREKEIDAARDGLHFAFVTVDEPPYPFYVRVSGPGLLIEIDNTEDGDHLHAVWHRPGSDFGQDLLVEHLERHHGRSSSRHRRVAGPKPGYAPLAKL